MLKVIMFSYLFWFVLTIIFITGTTRISVFCMGYLVACFYFLLFGGELLLKPIKKILHYWDFLIAYNIFVITMKNILSVRTHAHTVRAVQYFVLHGCLQYTGNINLHVLTVYEMTIIYNKQLAVLRSWPVATSTP